MKISVVTAVYNREATINRALRSVREQTHSDTEHIIVDGGSSDGTLKIVASHRTEKMIVLSEPDEGIYDAINKGIELSTGDVVGLLHSDDLFTDNTVLSQVAEIFRDEQVDLVYADAAFFRPGMSDVSIRRYRSSQFSPGKMAWGWMPAHTTLFVRRTIFDRFGLYRKDFTIAGDFEFVVRVFRSGDVSARYIPKVWVRMQTGGASTRGLRSKIILNREVMRACQENGIRTNLLMIWSKYPRKALEYFVR